MTKLIDLFDRANEIDGDGDMAPVTDATAFFFLSGSSTPLTVYEEAGLTTPRGTSVDADANGIFPKCYTDQATVKLDIRDGSGASLDGYPIDEFPTFPDSGNQASGISATPQTGNSGTTVAAQLNNNTARGNALESAAALPTSSGAGGAYAIASTYTITAYEARLEREFIANHTNVGGGTDTLNVDAVGAVTLKKYEGSTSKTDLAAGDILAGDKVRVKHDGTHFVVVSPLNAGEATKGIGEIATPAEIAAGTAGKLVDAAGYIAAGQATPPNWVEVSTTDISSVPSTLTVTGLSGYRSVRFWLGAQYDDAGSALRLEARETAGTWRTLAASIATGASVDDVVIASGEISNFNNADGTGFRGGRMSGATDNATYDDTDSEHVLNVDSDVLFTSNRDEVWDELRIDLSSGNFDNVGYFLVEGML